MSRDTLPTAATVVVSRRVLPGRESDFLAWDGRLRGAAGSADGFLGSDVQPPNPSHPDEWVRVYSFATVEQLNAWLQSDVRTALVEEAEELIEGHAREQQVAGLHTSREPVTVVFSQRISPAHHDEFVARYDGLVDRMAGFAGFLNSELLRPVDGVQDEHVIVATFASRAELDRWLESGTRAEWLDGIDEFVEGDRTMNVVGGFGGWFPARSDQSVEPKRWKQALAVFIALFPTSLAITLVRGEIAPNMNVVLGVLIGNLLGILLLTYVFMPVVTRWLRNWLAR